MVWQFLKILNMESPSDLKFLLGEHPKELKTGTQADTCTPTFITVFIRNKIWKTLVSTR